MRARTTCPARRSRGTRCCAGDGVGVDLGFAWLFLRLRRLGVPAWWEGRLDTPAVAQLGRLREFFASFDWWALVPDESVEVLVGGRGEPVGVGSEVVIMGNDYVTAARAGGSFVAYVPTARPLTVDPAKLAQPPSARWVDPADATAPPVEAGIDASGTLTTPGRNSAGGEDWLLLLGLQA
jgi:hypothetical protein